MIPAFLNLSRDLAKYILYPRDTNMDARPVVIYGAGSSGNELFQSVLLDPSLKVVAFYDDSSQLKNRQINNIPILGSFKKLVHLKKEHKNLEVLLAIPSIDTKTRRAIISKLEDIKVAVRTVPSFHELMSDQKKMTDIQNLSLDDLLPRGRVETNTISNAENQNIFRHDQAFSFKIWFSIKNIDSLSSNSPFPWCIRSITFLRENGY